MSRVNKSKHYSHALVRSIFRYIADVLRCVRGWLRHLPAALFAGYAGVSSGRGRWLRDAFSGQKNGGNDTLDIRRRNFIKLTVFGGAIFLVGRYFGPFVNMLRGDTVINETLFSNFKVTETGKELRVTDDEGEEFLIIEKENF